MEYPQKERRCSYRECGDAHRRGGGEFTGQPPLTCDGIAGAVAIVANESGSAVGQVLLLGGYDVDYETVSTVFLVDLATGVCTHVSSLSSSSLSSSAKYVNIQAEGMHVAGLCGGHERRTIELTALLVQPVHDGHVAVFGRTVEPRRYVPMHCLSHHPLSFRHKRPAPLFLLLRCLNYSVTHYSRPQPRVYI